MRPSIDCCCAFAVDPAHGRLPAGQRIFARNRQPGIALDQFGTEDETADRNNNGIIDAIDDTVSLIDELKRKGYSDNDIEYLELKDGRHNVPTWARAFPDFLKWGWGK